MLVLPEQAAPKLAQMARPLFRDGELAGLLSCNVWAPHRAGQPLGLRGVTSCGQSWPWLPRPSNQTRRSPRAGSRHTVRGTCSPRQSGAVAASCV